MNVVIGIGDSWTQGQGGYPDHIWIQYNGHVNVPMGQDKHLLKYEFENSWVNVLCRDHFTDHTPVNLGKRGCGNRGAVRQLYFMDKKIRDSILGGYLIFVLSGWDRFDFFSKNYTNQYYPYNTVYPWDNENKLWKLYFEEAHSEISVITETLCCILEAQTFAKAHNLKFIFANAFDPRGLEDFNKFPDLVDQINFDNYLNKHTNYQTFVDKLMLLDGYPKEQLHGAYNICQKLSKPNKHMTKCFHPTTDGYKVIAAELYNFIKHV